ncbi:hypothetical protein B0T26DRAFT_734209 [Lasiosphaeria miniovina]|uniref:Uncharacterized protein n=1 Tax=Lasiosphaeria miniovina TaxID=1954250 RepID=A0AA39ZQD6_9PEZI|nr:uncharacterized protein B0T26DRAFT_734209 [Lasiosphaeria miniovina]KAK0701663.1 hypothetical protein B0T26DRAFT_734209 [Lasiosphaeria miniovina]
MDEAQWSQGSPAADDAAYEKKPEAIEQAADILLDAARAQLPRSRAYVHARQRFWDAFPGGRFVRLATPGDDLECALHAAIISMEHQAAPRSGSSLPLPTVEELRDIFFSGPVTEYNEVVGLSNVNDLTADQLSAVFEEWGRANLPAGTRCQLGYVTDDGVPVMMNTPDVETADPDPTVLRIWVFNDGASLRGGVGHYEGIRRPAVEGAEAPR